MPRVERLFYADYDPLFSDDYYLNINVNDEDLKKKQIYIVKHLMNLLINGY